MNAISFSANIVASSRYYHTLIDQNTLIGEVAGYLARHETLINAHTLEVASRVLPEQRIDEIGFRAGDRLALFTDTPRLNELPQHLATGEKTLSLRIGDTVINSRGKRSVSVGKYDETHDILPDVDLRPLFPPDRLAYISRQCFVMAFDEQAQAWFLTRTGQTRLSLDAHVLGADRVLLHGQHVIRFYRAEDNPVHGQALGELWVTVKTSNEHAPIARLPAGSYPVNIRLALEKDSHRLRASPNMQMGQIAASLAQYQRLTLNTYAQLYHLRLLSPQARVNSLKHDDFLYAALHLRQARGVLLLQDVQYPDRAYPLMAGAEDDDRVIGASVQDRDLALDVDLAWAYFAPMPQSSPYYARVQYRALDRSWWLRLDERASVAVFVNNQVLTDTRAVRLMSGDVITIGNSLQAFDVRLVAKITAHTD